MVKKRKILVIEDDPDILEILDYNLQQEGFEVFSAEDGERGLREAAIHKPALILLDLMLPGIPGLEVCRRLRSKEATRNTPLIMVTAKGEESDIVAGLELGAHDYITKPFRVRELVARVHALLRRIDGPEPSPEERLEHGLLLELSEGLHGLLRIFTDQGARYREPGLLQAAEAKVFVDRRLEGFWRVDHGDPG